MHQKLLHLQAANPVFDTNATGMKT